MQESRIEATDDVLARVEEPAPVDKAPEPVF